MNKKEYIERLSKELNCDYEYASKISNLLENNFLLGKENKEKIIDCFINQLNINIDEANKIYNISSSIIVKEVKNKIKYPFNKLDKKSVLLTLLIIFIVSIFVILFNNKTFFKQTYIGAQGQEIFIPRYSYFKDECCMTTTTFYSLKSEKILKEEIDIYMKDFEYINNENTYGYQKSNIFIQKYEVINKGFYREIIITY